MRVNPKLGDDLYDRTDKITLLKQAADYLFDAEGHHETTTLLRHIALSTLFDLGLSVTFNPQSKSFSGDIVPAVTVGKQTMMGSKDDDIWTVLRQCIEWASNTDRPVHEHDCEMCQYIATYPLRNMRTDPYDDDKAVGWADVWESCQLSDHTFIVRYGKYGEYSTTDDPGRYVYAPMVNSPVDLIN